MTEKKSILILGGTGIIGESLVREALKSGFLVTAVAREIPKRLSTNYAEASYRSANINSSRIFRRLISEVQFDVVVDLLSYNARRLRRNVTTLDASKHQYFFISTATIFEGSSKKSKKISETSRKIPSDSWDYSVSKLKAEIELQRLSSEMNIKYTIIRPYIVYSENRFPIGVWELSDLVSLKSSNSKFPIPISTREKKTNLTHTEDLARAIVSLFDNPKSINQDFNICNSQCLSWNDVYFLATSKIDNLEFVTVSGEECTYAFPELRGKLRDRSAHKNFDNSKFQSVSPEFRFEHDSLSDLGSYLLKSASEQPQINNLQNARITFLASLGMEDGRKSSQNLPARGISLRKPSGENIKMSLTQAAIATRLIGYLRIMFRRTSPHLSAGHKLYFLGRRRPRK